MSQERDTEEAAVGIAVFALIFAGIIVLLVLPLAVAMSKETSRPRIVQSQSLQSIYRIPPPVGSR